MRVGLLYRRNSPHATPLATLPSPRDAFSGPNVFYGCERGIVVSTSAFTPAARQLAVRAERIALWDRDTLFRWFDAIFPDDRRSPGTSMRT